MSVLKNIAELYSASKKPKDLWVNNWIFRPVAAVFVYALRKGPLTPNQVTFLSLFFAIAASAVWVLWRSYAGLLVGLGLLELAFILDCVDGQLARIRKMQSSIGGHLDFLMDEIKAILLIGSLSVRLAWQAGSVHLHDMILYLGIGLGGIALGAIGMAMTTFTRRPEYNTPTQATEPSKTLAAKLIRAVEWLGHLVIHYPAWIWIPLVFNRSQFFLYPYVIAHILYLGRISLAVVWKMGRSGFYK